jgi:hypothetical protein
MTSLRAQIEETLSPNMFIPEPFKILFNWMEENSFVTHWGTQKVGLLYSPQIGIYGRYGTHIEFLGNRDYFPPAWSEDVMNRLCMFARTGGDGSIAAFWLDDEGNQKIVHFGSGSGSTLTCVLADEPIDFLRLLAIGYPELCCICFDELFSRPPDDDHRNPEYQNWLIQTFSVTIPTAAAEIIKHPVALMDDDESEDPFWQWIRKVSSQ